MGMCISHGSEECMKYGAFHYARKKLCELAGYGKLEEYWRDRSRIPDDEILRVLFDQIDDDGEILPVYCFALGVRIKKLATDAGLEDDYALKALYTGCFEAGSKREIFCWT